MNILKNTKVIDCKNYQKLSYHLKFDNLFDKIISGVSSYRFFDISIKENNICFTPKKNYKQLQTFSFLNKFLNQNDLHLLFLMNKEISFNIQEKKQILTFLHLDWILSYQKILLDNNCVELIEYLKNETQLNLEKLFFSNKVAAKYRSNIYTSNKDSIILDLQNNYSKNIEKLSVKNKKLIEKNKLLSFIEIDKDFDNEKLEEFLKNINKDCNKIYKKSDISDEMKFSLKLRKIKRTNKNAMFIVNQNSIILDPRKTNSFNHELGHWYHTWFRKDIVNKKDAEAFANSFKV